MDEALRLSLEVLAVDVPLMILLGVPLGWLLARKAFPGRKVLELFVLIPVVLPPSVLGLYLLLALGQLPGVRAWRLLFSFPALILGALIPALPLVVQGARAGFSSVSRDLEDAARTLGDSEWRVFFSDHPAPGPSQPRSGSGPGHRPCPRGVWGLPHDRGQHSRGNPDLAALYL